MAKIRRLTMAQALVEFLTQQYTSLDGVEQQFFGGVFAIFGHGNVAGLGQALLQAKDRLRCYAARNEQAMVHSAVGFAKMANRRRAFACTSSIGPGATNMLTGAALATINRLPVLLLPGDIFATRGPAPVLQQLESAASQDISVNDCFKPVSRYWDRINRPEQLITALPEALRILTSPAETGAVTLCLPQDVQPEAFDYPEALFRKRVWTMARPRPDRMVVGEAAAWLRSASAPLIVAGGGAIYSEATDTLARFAAATGVPVVETMAGKGTMAFDHPQALGAVGVTGAAGANRLARDADLVIVVGSRLSDFTTASKTAFQHPGVRFINVNVAEFDAAKHAALPLVGDAKATLEEWLPLMEGWRTPASYQERVSREKAEWEQELSRIYAGNGGPVISQGAAIGLLNEFTGPRDVIVNAAGSLPGDLHKLWRARDPKQYHLEYGYSCMGYEIAAGLGIKMAAPDREVYVLVGDGSYLMLAQEIVTSIQEGVRLTILILDNHGFASIGGLSRSVGCGGFATQHRRRNGKTGLLDGDVLPIDFAANAESLGARAIRACTPGEIRAALEQARSADRTTAIVIPVDPDQRVPGYESWWDVPIAEVSTIDAVGAARAEYVRARAAERRFL
ncbi:MAG TPA: 3D-(3,5/4)-trihydroxycyclohexane-1,2-dione acylhydrolase (decyclizing) [Vicinamibacterales bacterium]|nr:3D-(3,5/4)-trihydroxycyclohexane-1,2-dione acylhydrolase (decyclizing) [Vicinamibacterales bacterium]